jgi:hypothetical protein
VAVGPIYPQVRSTVEGNKVSSHFPPLSLKPAVRGIILPEKTAEGYELRSRGPASQGFDALDMYSAQSRSNTSYMISLANTPDLVIPNNADLQKPMRHTKSKIF